MIRSSPSVFVIRVALWSLCTSRVIKSKRNESVYVACLATTLNSFNGWQCGHKFFLILHSVSLLSLLDSWLILNLWLVHNSTHSLTRTQYIWLRRWNRLLLLLLLCSTMHCHWRVFNDRQLSINLLLLIIIILLAGEEDRRPSTIACLTLETMKTPKL